MVAAQNVPVVDRTADVDIYRGYSKIRLSCHAAMGITGWVAPEGA